MHVIYIAIIQSDFSKKMFVNNALASMPRATGTIHVNQQYIQNKRIKPMCQGVS